MDDREFHEVVDEIFESIEDAIDELDEDIDIDSTGGVLTFALEDGSQIILSRQVANHEIWVAAKSGGFHLKLIQDDWHCETTDESLATLVNRVFSEQSGAALTVLQ